MAEEAYPLTGTPIPTPLAWSRMARKWGLDGIEALPTSNEARVTAGGGLSVNIAACPSGANIRGTFWRSDAVINKGLASAAGASNPRIDRVVTRVTGSSATPFVITGTAANPPQAPALTYTDSTYDMPLARVRVEAGGSAPSTITDERRFKGREIPPCLSTNRPDPQGQPLLAFEVDTLRYIYTSGDGVWNVGIGADIFRPIIEFAGDNGTTTAHSGWVDSLDNSTQITVSITFVAPPSGRAMIAFGAFMRNDDAAATTYLACRLQTTGGSQYWPLNTPPTSPAAMIINEGPGGAACFTERPALTLTPGTQYVATLCYRSTSGTALYDDRTLRISPLP